MKPSEIKLYCRKGIYGIRNIKSGRIYVGQTIYNFGDRRDAHFSMLRNGKHPVKKMQEDFNYLGCTNFEFVILHDLKENEDIDELERYYIAIYKEKGLSYNTLDGGKRGYSMPPLSTETRKHIGELNRVRLTGSKLSEDTRKKMSESHKSLSQTQKQDLVERARKLGKSHKGKKWTEEQRQAFIEEQKYKPRSAKYTLEQIKEIRKLYEHEGLTPKEIAIRFNIPVGTIRQIVTYKRWKNIS